MHTRRIAITQREEIVPSYGEVRDCLDQAWTLLLDELGFIAIPVPNALDDVVAWLDKNQIDACILSGGNDLACLKNGSNQSAQRDQAETSILQWSQRNGKKVLGVCRGMQMINTFLGGTMVETEGHVANLHKLSDCCSWVSNHKTVNSYHNWGISPNSIAEGLKVIAKSPEGFVEAVEHHTLPWLGLMWHPERDSPAVETDKMLLKSFFTDIG